MADKFAFDGKTTADTSGVSSQWVKRVKHGAIASMALTMTVNGPNANAAATTPDPVAHTVASHIMDKIVGDGKMSSSGMSGFDADAKNQVSDPAFDNAKKNTVLILRYVSGDRTKENAGKQCHELNGSCDIEIGTGTVIADSDIVDEKGKSHPNAILTAGHVIGLPIGQPAVEDPCTAHGSKCVAFSEDGRPLGRVTLRKRSGGNQAAENLLEGIQHDVVTLNVEPYNNRYQKIHGMNLNEDLPAHTVRADAQSTYHSESGGEMYNFGLTPGFSGGGAYNEKGLLVGVVTHNIGVHNGQDGKPVVFDDNSTAVGMLNNSFDKANVSMLDVVSRIKGQEKVTGIPKADLEDLNKVIRGAAAFALHNQVLISPVDTEILSSLGAAGQQSYHRTEEKTAERLAVVGNPIGQPMSMFVETQTNMILNKNRDNEVKLPLVDEYDRPYVTQKNKPIMIPAKHAPGGLAL